MAEGAEEELGQMHVKLCDFGVSTICEQAEGVPSRVDRGPDRRPSLADTVDAAAPSPANGKARRASVLQVAGVVGGTPAFFAPEMCSPGGYNGVKADLWALGASLYSMMYGRMPFDAETPFLLLSRIRESEVEWPDSPPISSECRWSLQSLLTKDPSKRCSLSQLRDHPWMAGSEPAWPASPTSPQPNSPAHEAALPPQPIRVSPEEIANAIRMHDSTLSAVLHAKVKFHHELSRIRARKTVPPAHEATFVVRPTLLRAGDGAGS